MNYYVDEERTRTDICNLKATSKGATRIAVLSRILQVLNVT